MNEILCPHCGELNPEVEKAIFQLGPGKIDGEFFEETHTAFFRYACCGALICQVDPRLISGEREKSGGRHCEVS
jgi:hypothetical protein